MAEPGRWELSAPTRQLCHPALLPNNREIQAAYRDPHTGRMMPPAQLNALTPQFGVTTLTVSAPSSIPAPRAHICAGTGNCIGVNDIKILCQCPPSLASFLAFLQANIAVRNGVRNLGISVSFPRGRCPRNPVHPH